jgi:hypothetical protein
MLILRRKEGQWVEITHRSGETIRLRVYNIRSRHTGQLDIAFEDDARNFVIQRTERINRLEPASDVDSVPRTIVGCEAIA